MDDLPKDLIASILAFLPAKDAGKTSVLSLRWRELWRSAPHLDLCALAPEAVDRVLSRHEGILLGCRIALSTPIESCLPQFLGWVALLAQKRIQTLDIRGHRSPMASTFPPGALAAARASLRHVALSGFGVVDPPELLPEYPHLTSLQLSTISSMNDDTLSQVLACCPRLEALSLSHCTDLVRPTISSPALRHLVLARLPKLRSVVIDTPALVTLTLNKISFSEVAVELLPEYPHLTSLQLSTISSMKDDTLSQVLARCPRLEALSLSHCTDLVHPTISSPALRHLVLARLPQLRSVVIDTPALVTLSTFVSDGSTECRHGAAAAFHEQAEVQACRCSVEVLRCVTNINDLRNFDINLSALVSLRRLAVHINLNDLRQVLVLRFMFFSCHRLEQVRIKNGAAVISGENQNGAATSSGENQYDIVPYLKTEVWRRPEHDAGRKNFCENLRELSLVGYTGTELEWEFLSIVTSKAAAIRRLSIRWCCGRCRPLDREAARARLSAMKRASKDLVITFQGQPVDPVLQQLQTEL